jgi:Tfp pilus assembly protein PilE
MIVVAIVGILSAIAYPSYAEYIRRGHRADARAGLLQAQQWLERAATATGQYPMASPAFVIACFAYLGWLTQQSDTPLASRMHLHLRAPHLP